MGMPELVVRRRAGTGPAARHHGLLMLEGRAIPVALGRSGTAFDKREGDGRSPAGRFTILRALYRPDRMARPATRLPLAPIRRDDGWCDDPGDRRYNRPVRLPMGGSRAVSHERMWREDHLYDLVLILDHNTRPRVARRGSAVFVHLARQVARQVGAGQGKAGQGFAPTEGCIALRRADMRRLLAMLRPGARIVIRHG